MGSNNQYNDINKSTITMTKNVNINKIINGTEVGYLRFTRRQNPKYSKALVLFRPVSL